jgi:glucose-1-phosphate thymidylyltransferase
MKGIVLAGGSGTRLYPLTKSISKQILPVYDKPMIYYPLSVLMLANIKDILIISTPRDILLFENLLGDGNQLGINIEYKIQNEPNGIAECFLIGEDFIDCDNVTLILGDNIFYGNGFSKILEEAIDYFENSKKTELNNNGAMIFGYPVKNPSDYGVVEFDKYGNVISLQEKPKVAKSNFAIPGLYFYDNTVIKKAKTLKPSKRKELEITSINELYLIEEKLKVKTLGRGMNWFDTGTPKGLLEASNFVEAIQNRQGFYIACLEEIAYTKGWIDKEMLVKIINKLKNCDYKKYLESLLKK